MTAPARRQAEGSAPRSVGPEDQQYMDALDEQIEMLRHMIRSSRPHSGSEEAHDAWDDAIDKAYAVLDTVRDELERLREERDAALDREAGTSDALDEARTWKSTAEIAGKRVGELEAEARRLTEGLREADEAVSAAHDVLWASYDEWEGEHGRREPLNASMWRLHEILRSLLSASPSDEPIDGETWGLMQGGGGAK